MRIGASVLIVLVFFSYSHAQDTLASARLRNLNKYYSSLNKADQFNGNIIIAKDKRIIFREAYNITGIRDSFKVSLKSKFIIASVSKAFVKVAILKLMEQGRLRITDTIDKYIDDFPNGNKITIEQLMSHRSGLPREVTNYENYNAVSLAQVIELARKETLLFEPNAQTAYSNVGYFLLHFIIDKVSSEGYFQYMQREIFDNLKLKNTFEFNHLENKHFLVYGFTNENARIEAAETRTINQFETGNVITTVNDLFTFSQKIAYSDFLNSQSKALLFHNDSIFSQAGGRKGYRAYLEINLKNNTTFILLSNQSNIPFEQIVKETDNILENGAFILAQKVERKETEVPLEILNRYPGTYISSEHKLKFTIKVIDKHLVAIEPDNGQTKLFAEAENIFFDNPTSRDIYSFLSNENGEVTSLQILTNGMKIKLEKVK